MNFIIKVPDNQYFQKTAYYSVHESKLKYYDVYTFVNSTRRLKRYQHEFRFWNILKLYPKLKFFCVGFKKDKKTKKFNTEKYNKLRSSKQFL